MNSYFLVYIFLIWIFAACNQKPEKTGGIGSQMPDDTVTSKKDSTALNNISTENDLAEFSRLEPIAIINPKSKNVYEKYGIEFSGNCYECDLAVMLISKKIF